MFAMSLLLAAGLFDNPWVVAVILVGGALINWLSQRRQAKEQQKHSGGEVPTAGEFNMEEALRRLLGEETPPPAPAPPPLPRTTPDATKAPPRRTSRLASAKASRRTSPGLMPPPVAATRTAVPQTSEQATARFEQLNEQGRHPAQAIDLRHRYHPRGGARVAVWRNRQGVRRAFVASLVFAPPKGLEP
jgi:hypothetical protein